MSSVTQPLPTGIAAYHLLVIHPGNPNRKRYQTVSAGVDRVLTSTARDAETLIYVPSPTFSQIAGEEGRGAAYRCSLHSVVIFLEAKHLRAHSHFYPSSVKGVDAPHHEYFFLKWTPNRSADHCEILIRLWSMLSHHLTKKNDRFR